MRTVSISLRSALVVGYTVLLCLIVVIVTIACTRMESLNSQLGDIVRNRAEKIDLAHSMQTALRERAIVMHTIAALSDPFKKDEYWIRFNELGTRFVIYRDALLERQLSGTERHILTNIRELTSETQPFVVSVVDQALAARTNKDTIVLLESIRNDAVPRQMLIAEMLDSLVAVQKKEMEILVKEANDDHERAVFILGSSAILALMIGLVVAFVSTKNATKVAESLHRMAMYDNLTNLPNRVLFLDRASQALAASRRDCRCFTVLSVDLNGFKGVNDSLGHHYGDLLLSRVAMRFLVHTRESDAVSRFGGDEFAFLLHNTDSAGAETFARNINSMLSEPFDLNGHHVSVNASIGVAVYPEHGQDIDLLMQRADAAMYVAKQAKSGYEFHKEACIEHTSKAQCRSA